MDMRNLLLFGLVLFGVGSTGYGQFFADGNTLNELYRNGILALLGAGGLTYNNIDYLKSFLPSKKTNDTSGVLYKPEDFETEDFRCLVHLRNRVKAVNDEDGLNVVARLNDILFNLSRRNKKETVK